MPKYNEPLPVWNAPGVEPPNSLKNGGWRPEQKPPADYFDWLQNVTYKALLELQQKAATSEEAAAIAKALTDAIQVNLDAHKANTTAHGSTSAATANTIIQRDANGQANVGTPTSASHIARKAEVDGIRLDTSKSLLVEVRTSDPVNPEMGRIWFRSDL